MKSFSETGISQNLDVLPEGTSIRAFPFEVDATICLADQSSCRVRLPQGVRLVVFVYDSNPGSVTYRGLYIVSEGNDYRRRGFPINEAYIQVPRDQDPPALTEAEIPKRLMPVNPARGRTLTPTKRPDKIIPGLSPSDGVIHPTIDLNFGSQGLIIKDDQAVSCFCRINVWLSDYIGLTGEASILPQDGIMMRPLGLMDQESRVVVGLAYRNSWLDRLALLYGQVEDSTGTRFDAWQAEAGISLFGIHNQVIGKYAHRPTRDAWLRTRSEFTLKSWGRAGRLSLGGEYLAESYKLILPPGYYSPANEGDRFYRTRGSGFIALSGKLGFAPFCVLIGAGRSSRVGEFFQAEAVIGRRF
ncbi:MAG: hypothetical protein V1853_03520 [bacterium]